MTHHACPRDSYELIARRALSWTLERCDEFRLPSPDDPRFAMLLKPLGELALTASVLRQCADAVPEMAAPAERLLRHCWSEFREGEVLAETVRDEPALLVLVAIYVPLREAGLRSQRFERTVRALVRMRGISRLEFPAWRELELALALAALDIDSPWDAEAAYARTWLAGRPEPWLLCTSAAYSVTHTVFYRTAFGAVRSAIPKVDLQYLVTWLPLWFEHYASAGDFDIASEIITLARCIGATDLGDWSARLRTHQREDGMVPGPAGRGGGLEPACIDPRRRTFLDNYHTTLVALMAAAMSVRSMLIR